METIDVVMTTYLRKDITENVIKELRRRTRYPIRLLVIDNGSWDGLPFALDNMHREGLIDVLHLLGENLGLERARNLLIPMVQSKYVIFTDSDIMPQESDLDWLTQLIEVFERNPEYGGIALRPQIMVGSGDVFGKNENEIVDFPAAGYCRISLTEDIRNMGGWRNEFVNGGLGREEHYLSEQMKKINKKCGYIRSIRAWHFFGDNKWWGYPDGEYAGHRDMWPRPVDVPFDWKTCIPL